MRRSMRELPQIAVRLSSNVYGPGLAAMAMCLILVAGCQSLRERVPAGTVAQNGPALAYVGQQILPNAFRYAETVVGGLSGIEHDPATGRYWLISDDRSENGPARFYEVSLDLGRFDKSPDPGHAAIDFRSVHAFKRLDGSTFADHRTNPGQSADPESIRVHGPSGRLVWISEGERIVREGQPAVLVQPHVWEIQRDGTLLRPFVIPDKFRASSGNRGIRRNAAFEGLAFSPDFSTLYVATENALLQDGPAATQSHGSPSRLLALDYASGQPRAEYVIDVSPIPAAPTRADGVADNGIVEILALDNDRLLMLERSFVPGFGNFIKLFIVDLRGATDVSKLDALAGQNYVPAKKHLLFDFATLGIRLDNIEGMTWGPRLANGARSLITVSDNNFNPRQIQQFLLFEFRDGR